MQERSCVAVRVRGPSDAAPSSVFIDEAVARRDGCAGRISVRSGKDEEHCFDDFNFCLGPGASNRDVFEKLLQERCLRSLEGYNCAVLAYGQTGSGKTHTLLGPAASLQDSRVETGDGVVGMVVETLWGQMEAFERERDCNYSMQLQIIEIYNEQITDLMSADARGRRQLVIRDGSDGAGPEVAGAVKRAVQSASQTCAVITECMSRRTIGRTDMNCLSSRSHLVITFFVRCEPGTADATSASVTRLHICDLAGSERQPKTGAQGQRLREGCQINQSLSTLSSCISALADKSRHVPYRDSKLTRLLSDSLGGSALLLLLLTVSPAPEHANETLQTLRFGARAIGGLQGTVAPVRREREPDSAQLAALQERCWVAEASLARLQAAVTPVHQRGKHADWATGTALASSCVALLLYVVVEVVWAHVGWRLTDGHGAEEQAARSAAGGFGAV